jgi:hypothetical protein
VSAVESLFQNRECSERVQRKSRLSEKEQGEEIERRNREKKQRVYRQVQAQRAL